MRNVSLNRHTLLVSFFAFFCIAILFFTSCGKEPETTSGTGSIAFSVEWKGAPTVLAPKSSVNARALDCTAAGVSTVEANVYDENNSPLASGGPWDCEAHQGTITGVPAGSNRKVVILGKDSSGNVIYRGETTGITVTAGQTNNAGTVVADLFNPTLLAPEDGSTVTNGAFSFEWSSVTGASEYQIQVSVTVFDINVIDETVTSTSYTPTTALSAHWYHWRVRAEDGYGNQSAWSWGDFTVSAEPGTAPSAPANVTATAGDGQVTISRDSVSGATSYNIYWATYSGVSKVNYEGVVSDATSPYTHTGLTNGTTYHYVVTAENSYGESDDSSEVFATPSAVGTAPTAPTNISAIPGDEQVTISWDSVSGATSYNIYWATWAGVSKTAYEGVVSDATSPYTHTGRTNDTTYYYAVTAENSYGESIESSEVFATPSAAGTAPNAPTNVSVLSNTSDKDELSWEFNYSSSSRATGIAIARKTEARGIYSVIGSVPANQVTFIDTGLTPSTTYYYKLYAYDSYDPSSISDYTHEVNVTTRSFDSAPTEPSGLAIAAIDGWTVEISWNDDSTNEDGFILERSTDGVDYTAIKTLNNDVISFTDCYVAENTTYYYRIKAYNNIGDSSYSTPSTVTTPDITATELSGGISADTTFSHTNSPYFVTSDVTLAPDYTLTVEPGVHIRFAVSVDMEIRGHLEARGTASDPIIFTAEDPSRGSQGDWGGIYVANELGGSAIIQHAEISFASTAVSVECCHHGGPVEIYDTIFENNSIALGNYAGWDMLVYRSAFINNNTGTNSADKIIAYSKFLNNTYGLNATERISVYYSIFRGHTEVALYGGRRDVKYCTIVNNNIGLQAFFEGFNISFNTIVNNNIGIILGAYDSYSPPIEYNNIYENATYNIVNNHSIEQDATSNWWGTTLATDIDAKIWDFYDDPHLGIINYSPFLEGPIDIIP